MDGIMLGLLADSFIHPGSGQDEGAIDLPVAREKPTDYPFVPGSGVKGALRDKAWLRKYAALSHGKTGSATEHDDWKQKADSETTPIYGDQNRAGNLILSDAKLLLLPVRSLTTAYVWLTCPHLLERYARDCARLGAPVEAPALAPEDGQIVMAKGAGKLFLEEWVFERVAKKDEIGKLVALLGPLVADASARARLPKQLGVVSDQRFAWFARHGLPIMAHNKLSEAKTSENLWYEETLPPDTLLYAIALGRRHDTLAHLTGAQNGLFKERPFLQLGGNETVGQGWLKVTWVNGQGDET
jgi:CRISPR-associated protein Cmr4